MALSARIHIIGSVGLSKNKDKNEMFKEIKLVITERDAVTKLLAVKDQKKMLEN